MASEKREIEISDEDSPAAVAANKRIKIEPNDDDGSSEQDGVATVVSDKQHIIKFVLCDLETEKQTEKAFRDLVDLCCNSDTARAQGIKKDLITLGGPAAVLRAMKNHSESLGVQWEGLRALGSVLCITGQKRDQALESVTELGGIETTIDVMRRFSRQHYMQEPSLLLLGNLSLSKVPAARIADTPDGIPAIVKTMKKFSSYEMIQELGSQTLKNISTFNVTSHNDKIIQAGGLVVLVEALTNYPDNDDIQAYVRRSVEHLLSL